MKKIFLTLFTLSFIAQGFSQVLFNETFDGVGGPTSGGPGTFTFPAGWTLVDVDTLTPDPSDAFVNAAWIRREDFNDNVTDSAAFSNSWYNPAGIADDWMWTPAITIPNSPNGQLSWRAIVYDVDFPDGYEVRIMIDPNTPNGTPGNLGNMVDSSVVLYSTAAENEIWTKHNVSLAAYSGKTVRIGFRNHSNDDYLLLIDDVKAEILVPNDIGIESINTYPDEYVTTPSPQLHTFSNLGATLKNCGTTTVSGVYLQTDIYQDGVKVSSTNSVSVGNLVSGSSTSLIVPQIYMPAGDGVYQVRYIAKFQGTDMNTVNDTFNSQPIGIYDSTYARDNNRVVGALGIGAQTGDGVLASFFEMHQNTMLTSVTYYLNAGGNITDNRTRVKVYAYDLGSDLPGNLLCTTNEYTYTAGDSVNGVLVTVAINPPLQVATGTKIYVGVEEHGQATMTLGATYGGFTPNASRTYWGANTAWNTIESFGAGFNRALFIRPNFGSTDCPFITSGSTGMTCSSGGSAQLNVSAGASPYIFAWSNGSDSSSAHNLNAGVYGFTVTSGICATVDSISITDETYTLNVGGTVTDASTSTSADGSISLTITDGVPPYTSIPANLAGLTVGEYVVTVTDSNLCTGTDTFTVSFTNAMVNLSSPLGLHVYPNPFTESLQIIIDGLPTNTKCPIGIADALGRKVYNEVTTTSPFRIQTTNWQAGVYTLQIIAAGETFTRKVVLQR